MRQKSLLDSALRTRMCTVGSVPANHDRPHKKGNESFQVFPS